MKSQIYVLASLLLLGVSLHGPARADSGPSAHGGGSTFIPDRTIFGLTAVTRKNGTVHGNFQVRVTTTGEFVRSDVQCLDVVGGDTATVSGVIIDGFLAGSDLTGLCYVATGRDNGEGAGSPPDLVSFLFIAPCGFIPPESACVDLPQPTVLPVDGNFQVKP